MTKTLISWALTGAVAAMTLAAQAPSNIAPGAHVGPLPGGGFLLNNGWTIRPAGEQVPVDTLPMSTAVSSNGKYLLVLNAGYNAPSVSVIDIASRKEVGRTPIPDAWLGLCAAKSRNLFYVGGATKAVVYELELNPDTGALTRTREFAAVADLKNKGQSFIGDVVESPDERLLYATDLYMDSIAVIEIANGKLLGRFKTGSRPYRLMIPPDGKALFVSAWGDGSVYRHDLTSGAQLGRTRVAPHPTDMVWLNKPAPAGEEGASDLNTRVFVAAANTNTVYSYGVMPDMDLKKLEAINVSLTPLNPLGMTPSALALDKDGHKLYVVCSDANTVAVADISTARSAITGFIPTGWYPTAVRVLADYQLVILNGKGLGSRANPDGPIPTKQPEQVHAGERSVWPGYVAHMQTGTVAFLPAPTEDQMNALSETVAENSPYRDELIYDRKPGANEAVFAKTEGHASPIQHVIYIIKENRTYDQVLGDLDKGNGDKSLNLFSEQITPNLHQLAREFIDYDNFYENADVSAEGHNWASAAIAPDYTVKLWPNEYGGRSKLYDFEGGEPANTPPAGYIWNNALQASVSIRDYGQWAQNLKSMDGPRQIDHVRDPSLAPYTDMNYRAFDLEYPDVKRAQEFIGEWKEFDAKGQAPQLMILRMGNDHTYGTRGGKLTPFAMNADNDYAVGQLVDAVSHSKLWASTAIFIIEDDAQNGPDHVDSHRAPAWVISPFTHRGVVDSTMYNQAGVLHTMELILGLRPMTQFDAAARPMFATFSTQPDLRPYSAIEEKTSMTERNPEHGPGAAQSAKMDFHDADLADDDELNDVLWRAIKGSEPPAPVRSAFGK
ncbi:MAG TPA: bifunctional YncE family protein/alkaline phosphatase family protein [Bryobacteraceae bacterium]|jgi:DNA-binding beta-propeller fold protein YncE|nr:bifunctional YncE family protein/alkaline phosphatase family protein [Bryobacteraceae bacterium]